MPVPGALPCPNRRAATASAQRAHEAATFYVAALDGSIGTMSEHFERHRQPWTPSEIAKLHQMVAKGMSLKAICKSLTRSEESVKIRAKLDKLDIARKR